MGWLKSVKRAAGSVTKTVTRTVSKAGKVAIKQATKAVKTTVRVAEKAGDVTAKGLDLIYKAGTKNPMIATSLALGKSIVRGDSLLEAAKAAQKAGIKSVKDSLQYAQMVAPFVPGIGSGAAAALAAGGALASGKSITDAMIKAARAAVPGGELAATAFDAGVELAKGKSITAVALAAARDHIPGGKEGKIAFDAAVALSRGQSLQKVAKQAGQRVISPYAADVNEFMRSVKGDVNIQEAALSRAGRKVFQRSKRAAERSGIARRAKRIEGIAQRRAHAIKVPKSMAAAVRRAKLAVLAQKKREEAADARKAAAAKKRPARKRPARKRAAPGARRMRPRRRGRG